MICMNEELQFIDLTSSSAGEPVAKALVVPKAASATAAIEALRKVEAIASVRLIELGKL